MEREGDYNLEEKRAGVRRQELLKGRWKIGDMLQRRKTFLTRKQYGRKTWPEGRKNPKKGFTEYVRFIWPYVLFITFVFFGSLVAGYISAASFPSMADTLRESFSSRFGSIHVNEPSFHNVRDLS